MNWPTKIALAFVALLFVGPIVYWILQRLKGSIEIKVQDKTYRLGELISGTLSIQVRRSMIAQKISVTLECFEIVSKGKQQGNTRRVHYSEAVVIRESASLQPGNPNMIPFSIKAPEVIEDRAKAEFEKFAADKGALLQSMVKVITMGTPNFQWRVLAHVELPGVDLDQQKGIKISSNGPHQ